MSGIVTRQNTSILTELLPLSVLENGFWSVIPLLFVQPDMFHIKGYI